MEFAGKVRCGSLGPCVLTRGPKRDLRADYPDRLSWVETLQSRESNPFCFPAPPRLTLGELEPLAGALLAVLLPLVSPWVTGQESEFLQFAAKLRIEFHQRPGNSQTGS